MRERYGLDAEQPPKKKGAPRRARPFTDLRPDYLNCDYVFSLRSFLTVGDGEFDFLAFGE